jgi:RNA polymerase sigma-70 factor (ECF subfamily)
MEESSRYRPKPTETLLLDLISGDGGVWHGLVEEYSGFIFAVVRRTYAAYGFTVSHQDVEDTVAEVWKNLIDDEMKVIKRCIEYDNFLPTLHVIARNRSIDRMRKQRRNQERMQGYRDVSSADEPNSVKSNFTGEDLLRGIDQLPPKQRILIRLFFLQRKKYREISDLTGIPQNSIGPTLARAVTQLRDILVGKNLISR